MWISSVYSLPMCLMCAPFKSFFNKLTHGFVFIFPLGIFVALALRFDVSRGKHSQYFRSAFLGYSVGLVLTIVVMNWFQAAQVTIACSLWYSSLYSTFRGCSLTLLLDSDGFFFLLYLPACSIVYCTFCHWIFGGSLHMEWWSQTGLFITLILISLCYLHRLSHFNLLN